MPKIRNKLVYSALLFKRKELQSMVANTLTKGLDFVKVLPRFVEIADVTYDHNSRELSIDYSINFSDIYRTQPSPEDFSSSGDHDEY